MTETPGVEGLEKPYTPAIVEYGFGISEFVIADVATVAHPGEQYDTLTDMETGAVVGFQWPTGKVVTKIKPLSPPVADNDVERADTTIFSVAYGLGSYPDVLVERELAQSWSKELLEALDVFRAALSAMREPAPEGWRDHVRPEVAAFALLMERELRANDHKSGWKDVDRLRLARHMRQEADELCDLLHEHRKSDLDQPALIYSTIDTVRDAVAEEAADVANMAMMVADVCGCLAAAPEPPAPQMSAEARDRSKLDALIAASRERVNAMSPEELAAMLKAQGESWVRGMAPCEHGVADWEQCPDCRSLPTNGGGE